MNYHIISTRSGYYVAELGLDQYLHLLHSDPMVSAEAAETFRDDLANERCPLPMTSPTTAHDPGEHAARCYDIAVRMVEHLPQSPDAWSIALRIADARPWDRPRPSFDSDPDIPF